ncbi:MAG: cytochrome c peroxidase [Methylococcales bacterium]
MKSGKTNGLLLFLSLFTAAGCATEITQLRKSTLNALTPVQKLGQQLFFDKSLSSPEGQACASCHDPNTAFTDTLLSTPVSDGIVPGRTGTRNAPTAMYMAFSPAFHLETTDGESLYIGGQFLDGRAATLSEQAKGPFLNPDEMNNQDEAEVVGKLRTAGYADLFIQVYGSNALSDVKQAYQNMADAIAEFEKTALFSPFSSKYDYYLADEVELTDQEKWGLSLFNDAKKGNCAACHPSTSETATPPLFTDFSYDNLGSSSNPSILSKKGADFVDFGLGKALNDPKENGKFKVPTLRNIAKTAPYTHNGVFSNLRDVVEFYSTRDVDAKWGKPEVAENINKDELGDLKLTPDEIDAIVAFLQTLTDGYEANGAINHLNNSGLITLPLVEVEGASFGTAVMSVKLKQDSKNPNQFRLLHAETVKTTAKTNPGGIPHYSFDTNYLEIPTIKVDNNPDYIAQLKRIITEKEIAFEIVYAKPVQ